MKIATWNINSIRRRLDLVLDWLGRHRPDVLCLQETKVEDHLFPAMAIQAAGYHAVFRGMKGYNGVATLSLREPSFVLHGLHEGPDNEDCRVLQTVVDGIPIVNAYAPQGFKVPSDKYAFKLEWYLRMRRYFQERLDPTQPAIWTGDLNVAPEPIDVYHPDRRVNDPDFHIDARSVYQQAIAWGWTDTFRRLHPDRVQYTYWDYFRNAFDHNWGWRIDHILATEPLAALCTACDVDLDPRRSKDASDHTVLWADFEIRSA
jgi:exodeoxyribonuclease-3